MWKNNSNWKKNRGSYRGRIGRRGQQHNRDTRRGAGNRTGYEKNQSDRNFRPESREYGLDENRYSRSAVHIGIEIDGETYNRDGFQDAPTASFGVLEFNDNLYRGHDSDRRNVEPHLGHYDEIGARDNDIYWDNGRTQEVESFYHRDQELKKDDYHGRRDQRRFVDDNLNRFDTDFQNDRSDVRIEDQHHDRNGNYRNRGTHHHVDSTRSHHVHTATFVAEDRRGYDNKVSRHNWKDERLIDQKMSFKTRNTKDDRQDNRTKQGKAFESKFYSSKKHSDDRAHSEKKRDSSKTSSTVYRKSSEHKSSTVSKSKDDTGNKKRTESRDRSGHKIKSDSRSENKKSERKEEKNSNVTTTKHKTSVKDRNIQKLDKNSQKPAESRTSQIKHDSNIKQKHNGSDKKRDNLKKQSTSSSKDEIGSFKKPLDKQNQHRQRNNSGRKVESDTVNVHEEDILSIMADDDGFEREMRIDSNRNGTRSRGNRERGSQASDAGRSSSRDRERFDRHQRNKDSSTHNTTAEYDSHIEPLLEIHADASASAFGESSENRRSSEYRSPVRRNYTRRSRPFTSNNRYNTFGANNFRQSGRNNNYVGGRSGLSVASKIKDSYLKKRQSYQKFGYRGENNRQSFKSVNVDNQTRSLQPQKPGKNEIGKSGAVLKDDRFRENNRSSNLSNRDRSRSADNRMKGENFDRNSRSFSFKQNFDRNAIRNRFQGDRASFKSRGSAYQRVKRKYLKGGFGQNGNNSKSHTDRGKEYNREESEKNRHWSKRSVVDKNVYSDEFGQENLPVNDQQLDDQSLDPSQQRVIFIPNADLQTGQPHMIDQFGQIIVNPEDVQQNETQVPVQYLPQQFHHDGEQMVFIPFVNNQTQPGYSENLPLSTDENLSFTNEQAQAPKEEGQSNTTSDTKQAFCGKKPLSKKARANMKKYIELKRKQRMEKAIEQKVLRKLLSNPDISKAVIESKFEKSKKKPLIKRISPPESNKPSHYDKKLKVVRKGNNKEEFEDVSEDESKYDSDLEDVSEFEDISDGNEDYESRQLKRPVFRKPGQARIRKTVGDSSGNLMSSNAGDIRKVVDQRSGQAESRSNLQSYEPSRLEQVDVRRKPHQNDKNKRSVYIENSGENINQVIGQKRGSDMYESKIVKKRRSISPIEITVSNDHYSKVTSGSSRSENSNIVDYDSNKRKRESYRSTGRRDYSDEKNSKGRHNQARNDGKGEYKKVAEEQKYDDKERERTAYEEKGSKAPDRSSQCDRSGKKYTRNERNYYSGKESEENKGISRSRDRDWGNAGKYEVIKGGSTNEEKSRDEHRVDRSYNKNDDARDKNERRSFKSDDRRHMDEVRKDSRYSDRKRNDIRGQDLDRSIEELEHNRSDTENRSGDGTLDRNRNEGVRSLSRERSGTEGRNETRNIQVHERHRAHLPEDRASRNIPSNTFVSSMNQGQFQMNQPLMQQSMQPQAFMTAQSQSIPIQFSNSSNIVDHSLPPVQNSPMSLPPMPPPSLGVRPDMSLPPPMMNVAGTPTSMVIQQPNNVQFQQQPMPQVSMQQQQFQNMQPQFQQQHQQQFHQMQQQPQMVQQQPGTQQFQSQQHMYQGNLQSNQQMSIQQMHSGQFQQNQNVGMVPVNQNLMQSRVNQQTGSLSQGVGQGLGSGRQVIQTSMNQQSFVAATPEQAVRGMLGRVRIAPPMNQVSKSPTISRRSHAGPGRTLSTNYQEENTDEEDDDYLAEMLCSKCDKVFLSHEIMRRHGRWHDMIESNSKYWRCDQCEQGFTTSSGHADHMSAKHSRDSWNCSLCDRTFSNSSGLNKHVRQTSHKDLKVKFVCSLCPASFMVLMHLVQHKKENHQSNVGYSGLRKY